MCVAGMGPRRALTRFLTHEAIRQYADLHNAEQSTVYRYLGTTGIFRIFVFFLKFGFVIFFAIFFRETYDRIRKCFLELFHSKPKF